MIKKENKFFNFEKPIYDTAFRKIVIKNLQEERTKLDKFITDSWDKITKEESVDQKTKIFTEFHWELKKIDRELAIAKKEIKTQYVSEVDKILSEMQADCKQSNKEIQEEIVQSALKQNREDIATQLTRSAIYELRVKTMDIATLKQLQEFCERTGITYTLYKEGKVLRGEEKNNEKSREMEQPRS